MKIMRRSSIQFLLLKSFVFTAIGCEMFETVRQRVTPSLLGGNRPFRFVSCHDASICNPDMFQFWFRFLFYRHDDCPFDFILQRSGESFAGKPKRGGNGTEGCHPEIILSSLRESYRTGSQSGENVETTHVCSFFTSMCDFKPHELIEKTRFIVINSTTS